MRGKEPGQATQRPGDAVRCGAMRCEKRRLTHYEDSAPVSVLMLLLAGVSCRASLGG